MIAAQQRAFILGLWLRRFHDESLAASRGGGAAGCEERQQLGSGQASTWSCEPWLCSWLLDILCFSALIPGLVARSTA